MHHEPTAPKFFLRLASLLLIVPLLLASGCGGGSSSTATSPSTPSSAILAPKTLVGAVLVINYSDGRSYTFTFNSTSANGVTRSDGKTTSNWVADGYATPVLAFDLFYGPYVAGAQTNVFDDYSLSFTSQTAGSAVIRENTTLGTYSGTTPMAGTFTFTTYPPGG